MHLVTQAGWMYETQDETLQFTNLTLVWIYLGHILAHGFEATVPLMYMLTKKCKLKTP